MEGELVSLVEDDSSEHEENVRTDESDTKQKRCTRTHTCPLSSFAFFVKANVAQHWKAYHQHWRSNGAPPKAVKDRKTKIGCTLV